jgi:hypothetical protein
MFSKLVVCNFSHATGLGVNILQVSFLVSRSGVRLSPLGTSTTVWPTVPSPDDG